MASGAIKTQVKGKDYPGKITGYIFYACIIASTCGLINGYNIGISGGVTVMDSFLAKFFPSVHNKKEDVSTIHFCKFDSQLLALFTSSLYMAALLASFIASRNTRVLGRKWSIFVGGITSLIGATISSAAENVVMLIIGRIFSGIGVGFVNHFAPLYLSEVAPHRIREALNISIQVQIVIGILYANLVNYGANEIKTEWGWRISLGVACVPALIITLGSLLLHDTPNSLIECGKTKEVRKMIVKIRGTEDINDEYNDLLVANEESQAIIHPWRNIMQKKYRAPFTMSILIPFFQQLTGINVVMFYAPVLFKTIGFGNSDSLFCTVIVGIVYVLSALVSIAIVAQKGVLHRAMFFQGGAHMLICQVEIGVLIYHLSRTIGIGGTILTPIMITVFFCLYIVGFGWSWRPLGWLIPKDILPLEIRSAGQNINVLVNLFFTFIIGQTSLSMLCNLKWGLFLFFAGWLIIMTVFIYFFMPETKHVPIEEMVFVWKQHWFWCKFINDYDAAKKSIERALLEI